jgi:hypothetical protein
MGILKKGLAYASLSAVVALSGLMSGCGGSEQAQGTTIMYTSDAHYGIKRAAFSGMSSAQQVNGALVDVMNSMPTVALPADGGIKSEYLIGAVDFVVETGDAVNRSEGAVYPFSKAPAASTWPQFADDYFNRLNVKDWSGKKAPLYMTPGNHDVSNAIGYYNPPMNADTGLDATSYVEIYNRMMTNKPALSNTAFVGAPAAATAAASYAGNRVVTSRLVKGVLYVFVGMWPDSVNRPLIDVELAKVSETTPVILFTHDEPTSEAKHFTNPNAPFDINATNKYENLLSDTYADTQAAGNKPGTSTDIEQRAFVSWLKKHKNIVAYFHGNTNSNEFYTYKGPDKDISLNVFRVDSPMKGTISATDPTKLSFQVISIDGDAKFMTVREYLWNSKKWGASTTISLRTF